MIWAFSENYGVSKKYTFTKFKNHFSRYGVPSNNLLSEFMSILRPHPMLSTAGHAYDVNKMVVQLRMLSGRYRVGTLLKHFSPENSGLCELCNQEVEDLPHLLLPRCPLLQERKNILMK